jgi:outer membrane receptor for ferric coprogen and ferric-rhodotorulic acid
MTVLQPIPLVLALSLAFPLANAHAQLTDGGADAGGTTVANVANVDAGATPTTVVVTGDRLDNGYTTGAVAIGKGQRSLRETPQSVSVVTRERIDDQNLRTLDEVLQTTTGITVEQGSSIERTYYSRGFAIDTIQYDGVPTQRGSGFLTSPDLTAFERVEVLRGPAGLFNGAGNPGGTVNLVRKRPLTSNQVSGAVSAGRWNNYRAEADASMLLNERGSVRARVAAAHEDREFFYDVADAKRSVLYAIVEGDIGRRTTLGAGLQYEKNDSVPFYGGLPRFSDGRDLGLPRDTYLNAAWSRNDIKSTTAFADLRHSFNSDWKIKVGYAHMREDNHDISGSAFGTVNPTTNVGPSLSSFRARLLGQQDAVDATLEGAFDAFGRRHDVIVGANWQQRDYDYRNQLYAVANPVINPYTFNPLDYATLPSTPARAATNTLESVEQSGIYGSLRLALSESTKLVVGGRVSQWRGSTRNLVTGAFATAPYKQAGEFTPYAALSVDVARDWTGYISYAEIFRSQANQFTASGDRLDPATGSNYEAGLKGALLGGRVNASVAVFRILEENRSQTDPSNPSPCAASPTGGACYVAEGKVRSQGLDAEVSGALLPGMDTTAGYTFNQTRYLRDSTATGAPSANQDQPLSTFTPRHMVRLWTNYQAPSSPWSAGGGVNFQSQSYKTSGVYRIAQSSYAVWSGRIGYRINRNLTASVNLNNLFDKQYYRTLGSISGSNWYGEPRNVTVKLSAVY